jgi:tRNA threonylcarbamoyl adenosine modification protein YeaZ
VSDNRVLLALDTATRHPTLALVGPEGDLIGERQWQSEHRHGEQLLQELDALLAAASVEKHHISGVIAGVGPGSFTGLRIGLATAKTIAYSLDVLICGVSTTEALALAALDGDEDRLDLVVTLPAGATDRYVHAFASAGGTVTAGGPPQLLVPGRAFEEAVGEALVVAVDLDAAEDISDEAAARGERALDGLARAIATLGADALRHGHADDVSLLVPAYVALPRGIAQAAAEMTWSPDLR